MRRWSLIKELLEFTQNQKCFLTKTIFCQQFFRHFFLLFCELFVNSIWEFVEWRGKRWFHLWHLFYKYSKCVKSSLRQVNGRMASKIVHSSTSTEFHSQLSSDEWKDFVQKSSTIIFVNIFFSLGLWQFFVLANNPFSYFLLSQMFVPL